MTGGSAVVFGAGSIGRGLAGPLLTQAGMTPVFVEASAELRRRLAEAGGYCVQLTGRREEQVAVSGYGVIAPEDFGALRSALADCVFAVTAVGGAHLGSVAHALAQALPPDRSALPVLLCENWPDAAGEMSDRLAQAGVGPDRVAFVPASVERMVRPGEGLDLVGESCETLFADGSAWPGTPPAIAGLHFVDQLEPYYKRKLFTNNAGHAALAYLGALNGCRRLVDALDVPAVASVLQCLLSAGAEGLHASYGLERTELEQHLHSLLTYRYPNRALVDTAARVGRQPLRKLGPSERLTGLLRLLERHGIDGDPVHRTIAAALHYFDEDDDECVRMRAMIQGDGPGAVLEAVCGVRPDEPAYDAILRHYAEMRA